MKKPKSLWTFVFADVLWSASKRKGKGIDRNAHKTFGFLNCSRRKQLLLGKLIFVLQYRSPFLPERQTSRANLNLWTQCAIAENRHYLFVEEQRRIHGILLVNKRNHLKSARCVMEGMFLTRWNNKSHLQIMGHNPKWVSKIPKFLNLV